MKLSRVTGFYPSMIFIALVYNNGDWNELISDWHVSLHACICKINSFMFNAYFSLQGYNLGKVGL